MIQGLLRVTRKKKVEVLADEVEGLKFNLTDGVDVAEDGTIYFTDATYKHSLDDYYNDIIEGKPHGGFMNYNPETKKVTVLARNLYFPNGVVVSHDQHFVIYCETIMKRCRKYYIEGPKKGRIGEFCRDLPGMPDNIHYVGQGQYYIAMATSLTPEWDLLLRYPFIQKVAAMVTKYVLQPKENGGVLVVDLEGKPTAHYYDSELSLISNWVNTGGRPLGLTLKPNGELIVADAEKGLLRVSSEREIELLVDEYEGLKFKLTDGVDVADDGTIYFTDASHKYPVKDAVLDILEGKPNGRFFSYNPATKKTTLLAKDLYFANGVAVSADQQFVVFCESVLMICEKYYVQGPKKGTIEKFCDLPGMPDNIHYDGQGHYLIAMVTALTPELELAYRYPFIRKTFAIVTKYVGSLPISKNGGVLVVDLEGKPTAHYYDPKLSLTSAIKIGNHIYGGSIFYPFVTRFDIEKYPALPTV
ncbi:hypothetical protein JHK86_003153 [Glycine max]|nr:hypothetical protein JHK86_003153 [Glycine max]